MTWIYAHMAYAILIIIDLSNYTCTSLSKNYIWHNSRQSTSIVQRHADQNDPTRINRIEIDVCRLLAV